MAKKPVTAKNPPVKKSKPVPAGRFHFIHRWGGWIIALFAFLLYLNTLGHDFVLDDLSVITDNRLVQQGIKGIPGILTSSYRFGYDNSTEGLYRPLSLVLFALEKQIGGYGPLAGHLVNVLLYCFCCMMVFKVLKLIFQGKSILFPFIAALFFTAFPLHTEVVANIKSADEILCLLGFLLSVFFMLKYADSGHLKFLAGMIVGYFISLFSKENSVSFVLVFPMILYFFRELSLKKIIVLSTMNAACAGIFLFILFSVIHKLESSGTISVIQNTLAGAASASERLSSAIANMGYYFRLLIFPYPLLFNYSNDFFPLVGWVNWKTLTSCILLVSLTVYALIQFPRKNIFSFCILFFMITIAVVSNIFFLIRWTLGERFLFTPSLAFCIALTAFLFYILKIRTEEKQFYLAPGNKLALSVLVLLFLYSVDTIARNRDWKDNYTLFKTDMKKAPEVASTHALLAKTLYDNAQKEKNPTLLEESIEQFKEAIKLFPDKDFINELGNDYILKEDYENARIQYEASIKAGNRRAEVFHNLGIAEFGLKHLEASRQAYLNAIKEDSLYIKSLINVSNLFYEEKKYQQAVDYARKALAIDPSSKMIRNNMAVFFRDMGQIDSSKVYFGL